MPQTSYNLFDTRGGVACAHVCEVCNDPIDEESLSPLCPDCMKTDEEDEDV